MKKLYLVLLTILSISTFAQKNLNKEADKIIAEGKILYKSEMASWYGTDLFLEKYSQRENISGSVCIHRAVFLQIRCGTNR